MLMRTYKVVYSKAAINDIDGVVNYIISIYRVESGLRYKRRIQSQLDALAYCADSFGYSRRIMVRKIHSKAKTLSIMNRRWTVVFHIDGDYVFVDRIIPSKLIKG